jgi:hypothetical protein
MVSVFLAMACIFATVIAEQISEGKDGSVNSISEIHSLPGKPYLRVVQDSQPVVVNALEEEEDGKLLEAPRRLKLKWSFNPFNPWQSFKVSRLADEFDHKESGLRKRAAGCRMWSLLSGLFGRGHHHRREQGLENEEHHDHPHQPDVRRTGRRTTSNSTRTRMMMSSSSTTSVVDSIAICSSDCLVIAITGGNMSKRTWSTRTSIIACGGNLLMAVLMAAGILRISRIIIILAPHFRGPALTTSFGGNILSMREGISAGRRRESWPGLKHTSQMSVTEL